MTTNMQSGFGHFFSSFKGDVSRCPVFPKYIVSFRTKIFMVTIVPIGFFTGHRAKVT